jgi:hypothetical protein
MSKVKCYKLQEALEVHLGEPAFRETTTAQPEKTPEAKENGTENNNLIHHVPKLLLCDIY